MKNVVGQITNRQMFDLYNYNGIARTELFYLYPEQIYTFLLDFSETCSATKL